MKNIKTINSITHSILLMGAVISSLGMIGISSVYAQEQVDPAYKPVTLFMINGIDFIKLNSLNRKKQKKY